MITKLKAQEQMKTVVRLEERLTLDDGYITFYARHKVEYLALTTDINREYMATYYVRQKAVGNMAATFKLQNLVKRVKLLVTYCCNAHPKLNNSPTLD